MAPKSLFQPGDRVRLNLPGSKLHGTVGHLKSPRPPAGWWLVEADRPLELEDGTPDADRSFIAPDLWLELLERPAGLACARHSWRGDADKGPCPDCRREREKPLKTPRRRSGRARA